MRRKIIPYQPYLTKLATEFRNKPTKAEAHLWKRLKGKQVRGFDFHRQKPIDYYIVDFFCNELMLAIEIDGPIHEVEGVMIKDGNRQEKLEDLRITFLRFGCDEVLTDTDYVIKEIEIWIDKRVSRFPRVQL